MASLTSCIKKAGEALRAEDRTMILARAAVLRAEGSKNAEASRRAVDEILAEVRADLVAAEADADLAERQQRDDSAERLVENQVREPDAPYEQDLFGDPVQPPAGRPAAAARAAGNLQPARQVSGDTPAPAGDYAVRTVVGRLYERELGATVVRTAAAAAAATRYLYRGAVERMDGLVVDKNGKPLALVGGFKGANNQATVHAGTLIGEAVRVPGAAGIWFSHNHPSGMSMLSRADEHLWGTLRNALQGSGVEPHGLLAIGDGSFSAVTANANKDVVAAPIPESKGTMKVPSLEREQIAATEALPRIESPQQAKDVAAKYFGAAKAPGIVLLNHQHDVVAWVPLPASTLGTLRGTGGLNAIYRAVSEANASAAVLVHGGELDAKVQAGTTVGQNIGAALAKMDVRVLDQVDAKVGTSAAERGHPLATGPVFSRTKDAEPSPERAASAAIAAYRAEFGKMPSGMDQAGFRSFNTRRRAASEALAQRLLELGNENGLLLPKLHGHGFVALHLDSRTQGAWRVTRFDADMEPSSHEEYRDPQDAALELANSVAAVVDPTESDQDRSHREWAENYSRVAGAADLGAISTTDIERAEAFAADRSAREKRKGWDGGKVNQPLVDGFDREIGHFKAELKRRRAARDEAPLLATQSEADLRAKAAQETAAAKADAAEQKRLADKAKADAVLGEFTLTGSDRPVDVAAAAGQGSLFSRGVWKKPTGPTAQETRDWAGGVARDLGLQAFDVWPTAGGDLMLNLLVVPRGARGAGTGSEAMRRLVEYADRNAVRLLLSPGQRDDAHGTTSRSRLVRFYRRFGFVENKGRHTDFSISAAMMREPQPRFSRTRMTEQLRGENFRRWSGGAPLVTSTAAVGHDWATGEPVVVEAFHGTARPDRIGDEFKPKRATSGPMAFFTSSPEVASRYAMGKADTSLAYEDQNYENWFTYKVPGERSGTDIVRAWYRLSPEQQARVAALAPRVTFDMEGEGIVLGGEGHANGVGSYDYNLEATKRPFDRRGNPMKALVEDWLNSAALFNNEAEFLQVLRLAGFPVEHVSFEDAHATYPAVIKGHVAFRNPLVTGDVPQSVLDALDAAAKRSRARAQQGGGDIWDKKSRTIRDWMEAFRGAPADHVYVWTSIPDKVTDVLRGLGYDGIIDTGGKGGGLDHRVYIPFGPTQFKGSFNKGTYDPEKRRFNFSRAGEATRNLAEPRVAELAEEIRKGWSNAPEVVVVGNMRDQRVPADARAADAAQRSQGAAGDPRGFFHGGKVYLVASALRSRADVAETLLHESLGHFGLRGTFGAALDPVLDRLALMNGRQVRQKAEEYGLDIADQTHRRIASEEVLAELAQTRPELGVVRRAIAAIRAWLREHVPALMEGRELTDAEIIREYIEPARLFVEQGAGAAAERLDELAGVTTFARPAAPFFSALERGIDSLKSATAPAAGWRDAIKGLVAAGKAKADEVEWSGVNEWLALQRGKVAKEAVLGYLRENGVRVTEVTLADEEGRAEVEAQQAEAQAALRGMGYDISGPYDEFELTKDGETVDLGRGDLPTGLDDLVQKWVAAGETIENPDVDARPTKYSAYAMAGGTNYREVLLTLPGRNERELSRSEALARVRAGGRDGSVLMRYQGDDGSLETETLTTPGDFDGLTNEAKFYVSDDAAAFRSNHWDQPNVLAHIRLNDRTVVEPLDDQQQADKRKRAELQRRADELAKSVGRSAKSARIAGDTRREQLLAELRPQVRAGQMTPLEMTRRLDEVSFDQADAGVTAMMLERDALLASMPAEPQQRVKRVLFVEEIQSDWAQKGRKERGRQVKELAVARGISEDEADKLVPRDAGFGGPAADARRREAQEASDRASTAYGAAAFDAREAMRAANWRPAGGSSQGFEREFGQLSKHELKHELRAIGAGAIADRLQAASERRAEAQAQARWLLGDAPPSAPFVTTTGAWVSLAVKRIVKLAVDEGYDRVAFVTGQQSADRYDLSKQIKRLDVERMMTNSYRIRAFRRERGDDDARADIDQVYAADELPDVIGKEMAERVVRKADEKADAAGLTELPPGYIVVINRHAAPERGIYTINPPGQVHAKPFAGVHKTEEEAKAAALTRINAFRSDRVTFSGLDLQVGGKGIIDFYERVVPAAVKDVLKKIGGESRQTTVDFPVTEHERTHRYEGPDRTVADVERMLELADRGGRDVFDNPLTGQREDFAINRVTNAQQFRVLLARMQGGQTFAQAVVSNDVSPGTAPLFGGRVVAAPVAPEARQHLGFDITPTMREKAGGGLPLFHRGEPSAAAAVAPTDTAAFRRWFGDSKVVDAQGKPLVVYHGTDADFTVFRKTIYGDRYHFGTAEQANARIQTSATVNVAPEDVPDNTLQLVPAYLSIKNPIRLPDLNQWVNKDPWLKARKTLPPKVGDMIWRVSQDTDRFSFLNKVISGLEALGHDGIVYRNTHEANHKPADSWMAFRPEQIKSATGNRGTFDATNPDLRFSRTPARAGTTTAVATIPPAVPRSPWRDATNRLQFAPGQWLYNAIGRAASPLLTRLQMKAASPELRAMLRQMKIDIAKAQETAASVARDMHSFSEGDRTMVSDIIERELAAGTVPPEHAVRLAALMNQTMGAQSQELVRLDMLSAESAERWDGAYLPRFYENKVGKQVGDAWADAVRRITGRTSAMAGIKGKHLKGRGLYETVPLEQLERWQKLGWEVRDPDYNPGQPGLPGVTPADGTVQVWRDFTREERDRMGEIRDAGFRFVMGYMQTQRDIAVGRLFETLAKDSRFSSRTQAEGWVRVPDGTVEGTGAKRYGALAGRYVPPEVLSQLSALDEAQSDAWQFYRKAMGVWKMGKTSMNPVSHMNNVASNLSMAHFAGVSYHRADKYFGALQDFITKPAMMQEAKDAGLFLGTMNSEELLKGLPPELRALAGKAESTLLRGARLTFDLMTFFMRKPLGAAYEAEDLFFRYLLYKDARQRGVEPTEAVDHAQRFIFTYDDLPKGARMVRDFGIPFFAYTYKAIPALLHTALTAPHRMIAPAAVLWGLNAFAYAVATDDDDDWQEAIEKFFKDEAFRQRVREKQQAERTLLPPWMKGMTALATPKAIRLGMDEVTELPLFLDVSRIIPGGDLFDVVPNAGGIPLPQPFTPSHPLLSIAHAMLANRDTWTGKDLVLKDADTNAEAAQKRAEWIWRQVSPAVAVGNTHWERTMNALAQATGKEVQLIPGAPEAVSKTYTGVGRDGQPVQPKHAAMQTFGIKVRPIDLELSERIDASNRQRLIRDIDTQLRAMRRLNAKGAVSDKALDEAADKAAVKKERLREGLTVDGAARN